MSCLLYQGGHEIQQPEFLFFMKYGFEYARCQFYRFETNKSFTAVGKFNFKIFLSKALEEQHMR